MPPPSDATDEVSPKVTIPTDGLSKSDGDIGRPTVDLLRRLNLLPLKSDLAQAGNPAAAVTGPPDSVAVIEAGLTAGAKGWSVVIGASSTGLAAAAVRFWGELGPANQPAALLAAGLAIAAGSLGIAYILGSDVRGRSAAMVATIEARRHVATVMLQQAQRSFEDSASKTRSALSLAAAMNVRNIGKSGSDEEGWTAISARADGDDLEYLLIKGQTSEWVSSKKVSF